ncbi:MAG: Uma2 family endonuclease [Gammaproteobacteria bacterium]|nr:Uma2 family endonuclease [Gammaproteobacteria bacterium]MDE0192571.1 Uma2 family endonuclease [Gammaproteobacteria bacterium]
METPAEQSGSSPGQHFPNQPNLRFDDSVLRLAMPVEAYDCMMDHGTLPQECCYHADMMEVSMPNGIEHDARAAVIHELFVRASVESGARVRSGTTIPVKSPAGATPERRHPDAHLYLDAAKIERLRLDRSDPVPPPDIVVEIDWTPIAPDLASQRLSVYAAVGVPEVWTWERDGDGGRARIHVLAGGGYEERAGSAMVPPVRVVDLNVVLNEADEDRRMSSTSDLAHRIAEHWRDSSSPMHGVKPERE